MDLAPHHQPTTKVWIRTSWMFQLSRSSSAWMVPLMPMEAATAQDLVHHRWHCRLLCFLVNHCFLNSDVAGLTLWLRDSFIHSGYFYSASSSPLLLRLQHWYCVRVNTPKCYRQLWVKDLPKVPMWRLEWDLNLRPSGCKAPNLPLSHHAHAFNNPLMLKG